MMHLVWIETLFAVIQLEPTNLETKAYIGVGLDGCNPSWIGIIQRATINAKNPEQAS
jgi:hypothetical protein